MDNILLSFWTPETPGDGTRQEPAPAPRRCFALRLVEGQEERALHLLEHVICRYIAEGNKEFDVQRRWSASPTQFRYLLPSNSVLAVTTKLAKQSQQTLENKNKSIMLLASSVGGNTLVVAHFNVSPPSLFDRARPGHSLGHLGSSWAVGTGRRRGH